MRARTRGVDRHGFHGGVRGGCGGRVGGRCRGHGIPRNRSTVGKGDTPAYHLSRGQSYDLLTLSQTAHLVCPAADNASRYPSPSY